MNNTADFFTAVFKKAVRDSSAYHEALYVARMNADGKIWVIGGAVFRSIAQELYGILQRIPDYDMVAERQMPRILVPAGWRTQRNRHGNLKITSGDITLDMIPLTTIHSILRRKLPPTIENYLTGVPLTIQSIAFDVATQRVIGEIGMVAILNKTVAVLDPVEAAYDARMKDDLLSFIIQKKSQKLGFTPILPAA